jgi:HYR domain
MQNISHSVRNMAIIGIFAISISVPTFAFADAGITVTAASCQSGTVITNPTIVSDTSFIVDGNPAVPVTTTPVTTEYWTASVNAAGAQWMWSSTQVDNPNISETKTFTKTFDLTATTSGILEIAVDDQYSVSINGILVGTQKTAQPYENTDTYDLDSSYFQIGTNTLNVAVTNNPNASTTDTDPTDNPAGFLLSLNTTSCGTGSLFGSSSSNNTNQDGSGLSSSSPSTNPNQDGSGLFGSSSSTNPNQDNAGSTTLPLIASTPDVSTSTDSTSGIAVTFTVPTASEGSTTIPVVCSPNSGSNFPVGTTNVTCTATDASNNVSTSSFNVIVTLNATSTTSTTTPSTPTVTTSSVTSSGGGGGFYGGNSSPLISDLATGSTTSTTTNPLVLANSCPLITNYLGFGGNNNEGDTLKLQAFLKNVEGLNVDINGIFDANTQTAVKAFQAKYLSEIMGPWKSSTPSGIVYITTKKKINEIACGTTINLTPAEAAIIAAHNQNTNTAPTTVVGPTVGNTSGTTTIGSTNVPSTPAASTTGPIGSNPNTGAANTASVVNAPSIGGFWNWLKSIF